ncbi:MAG TPA: helix-turn-helix domain-containing protein [Verrucomicrobiae bacterium]|jgi:AraC-like DNA-binding protein|nr:helix-turn-helix domain-containing protein [Verrucomicrobiae bacterium]
MPELPFQLLELFDSLPDVMVWVKMRDGRYAWVNRAFLLNYALENPGAPKSIIGQTDYDLSPSFLADQFRLDDEHVLAGHHIVNRIELVGPSAEAAAWNVTNKIPFRDARGRIIGAAGLTRRVAAGDPEIAPASGFGFILAHLRDHYRRPITNHQLARLAKMSVRAFERKFLASFHLTPQKYLRRLRLGIASRTLVYTRLSLVEVALASGFADQSHFSREFKRQFKRTPRAYRERYAVAASGIKTDAPRQ